MVENTINERLLQFRKNLSKCVNVTTKQYTNKDLILSYTPIKKRIGFITYGKAFIIKTDIDGNTTIMRELKENDIFSIRRYGKYKFSKIVKNTKKDNIIIEYHKFI